MSASDEVTVVVKEDNNQPPRAVLPSTAMTLYLPTRAIDVDGSRSTDDKRKEKYYIGTLTFSTSDLCRM